MMFTQKIKITLFFKFDICFPNIEMILVGGSIKTELNA